MATSTPQRQSRPTYRDVSVSDRSNRYYGYQQNRTNAAVREYPAYQPEYQPRRPLERPSQRPVRPQQKSAQARVTQTVQAATRVKSGQRKHAFMLMARVGIVFVMCCLLFYRYAMILESIDQISKLIDALAAAEYNNQAAQAKIDRQLEISALEKYATEELGMMRPDQSQIFYVDIQLGDGVEGESPSAEKNALQGTPGALVHAFQVLK